MTAFPAYPAAMKIRKNTDHTLIVEDAPWLFSILIVFFILTFSGIGIAILMSGELAGLAFLSFGALMAPFALYLIARRVQVVFYRPEGWVEIRRANLLKTSKTRYEIGEIKRAIVESTSGENGTLYRVTLIIEKGGIQGEKPLTTAYSNVGKHAESAQAINQWLGVS